MKKLFNLLTFLLFFVGLTLTVFGQPSEPSAPYQVKHFALKTGSTLEANNATGDISVIGTDDRHASVAVLVTDLNGNFHRASMEPLLKHYSILIRQEKNKLIASAVRNTPLSAGEQELLISFRINVP